MIRVKMTTPFPDWPLIRQTPDSKGIWENCQFFINKNIDECDWWVVCEGLDKAETTICSRENTIFITWEPPTIKKYNKNFLKQFNKVITCHKNIKHPGIIHMQQGLPWMIGAEKIINTKKWRKTHFKNYDGLKNTNFAKKKKIISVISSNKDYTKGHRKRLGFLDKLKSAFGNNLDVFGTGINPISDKWDVIAPYKYHIAIENSSYDNYWTEKLSDSYMGEAYPFYHGCPNILDYFSNKSFTKIDINNVYKSIRIIKDEMKNNRYEKNKKYIIESKNLIMDKYNIFPMIHNFVNKSKNENKKFNLKTELNPEIFYAQSIKNKIISFIKIFV